MPITLKYESSPTAVIVKLTGIVTGDDMISANEEVAKCIECTYQLWDCSAVENFNVSTEDMHQLAIQDQTIPEHSNLSRIALVGSKKTFQGIDNIYHLFSNDWVGKRKDFESRSFDSVETALLWLRG